MANIIQSDVLVIGSGAVGNATAYYLSQKGLHVVVVDKDTIADGSSVRNGGLNKMNTRGIAELPVACYAVREIWPQLVEDMEKEGIDVEYKETGGYRTAVDEHQMDIMKQFYPTGQKYGLHIEYFDGNELRRRTPCFSPKIYGASWCKEDGRANPLKTTLGLYMLCQKAGVKFYDRQEVIRLETERGSIKRAITKSGDIFEADKICVTACYGSRAILNSVDVDIPFIHPLCEIFITEPVPKMLDEIFIGEMGGYYGHQTEHGSFLFGGGSYIGEYQLPDEHVEYRLTPDTIPAGVKGLYEVFPELRNIKIVRSWCGWHDRTVDNSAIIQEIDGIPGLYTACGFSGHGFGISPGMGKVLSELVVDGKTSVDISKLRMDRFHPLDSFSGYKNIG